MTARMEAVRATWPCRADGADADEESPEDVEGAGAGDVGRDDGSGEGDWDGGRCWEWGG